RKIRQPPWTRASGRVLQRVLVALGKGRLFLVLRGGSHVWETDVIAASRAVPSIPPDLAAAARAVHLRSLQRLGDLFLLDGAFPDDLPIRLSNIHRGGARAGTHAAVEHQVHATVHSAEDLDAAAAGRRSGDVGTGRDQRLVHGRDESVGDLGARLPQRQPAGVPRHLQRYTGGGRHDDGQGSRPEAPCQNEKATV